MERKECGAYDHHGTRGGHDGIDPRAHSAALPGPQSVATGSPQRAHAPVATVRQLVPSAATVPHQEAMFARGGNQREALAAPSRKAVEISVCLDMFDRGADPQR